MKNLNPEALSDAVKGAALSIRHLPPAPSISRFYKIYFM